MSAFFARPSRDRIESRGLLRYRLLADISFLDRCELLGRYREGGEAFRCTTGNRALWCRVRAEKEKPGALLPPRLPTNVFALLWPTDTLRRASSGFLRQVFGARKDSTAVIKDQRADGPEDWNAAGHTTTTNTDMLLYYNH